MVDIYGEGSRVGAEASASATATAAPAAQVARAAETTAQAAFSGARKPGLLRRGWYALTDRHGIKEMTWNARLDLRESMAQAPTQEMLSSNKKAIAESYGKTHAKMNDMRLAAVEKGLEAEVQKITQGGFVTRNARRLGKIGKWGAIGAAGLAAVGIISSSMRKGREAHEPVMPQSDPELDRLEAMAAANGPAPGRGDTEWRDKMRGNAQQGLAQPTPSAAEGAVTLGASRT